jgi:hypothetical protein
MRVIKERRTLTRVVRIQVICRNDFGTSATLRLDKLAFFSLIGRIVLSDQAFGWAPFNNRAFG